MEKGERKERWKKEGEVKIIRKKRRRKVGGRKERGRRKKYWKEGMQRGRDRNRIIRREKMKTKLVRIKKNANKEVNKYREVKIYRYEAAKIRK